MKEFYNNELNENWEKQIKNEIDNILNKRILSKISLFILKYFSKN